jgi:5-methylthioadenosine/S-adenosylhomocysteine deaminase
MILIAAKSLAFPSSNVLADNNAVVFRSGIITAAGPANKIAIKYPRHRIVHLKNAVLMPGLINIHTHLELPPLLETVRGASFVDWIMNLILAKKGLGAHNYRIAGRTNIDTLIRTGTTTVGEICTHGVSPGLLKQAGLRAVVFREIIGMGTLSSKFKVQSLPPKVSIGGSKLGNSEIIRVGISPHSPYTVSETMLRHINTSTLKQNIKLCMHVAESKDEIKLIQRKKSGLEKLYQFAHWDLDRAPTGISSFDYLSRIGFLFPRLLAVHAVQVTDKDIALINKSKTSVAHCPRSNKETRVGRMPLKKFLDADIPVGLGTDSLASSPSLSMWDEMRYAHRIHRRDGISAEDIFRLATIGGAKALGLDKDIGTIEPGKKADLIAVPLPKKNTGDIYSDLIRETNSCIMSVVNGKIIYSS